MKTDLEFDRFAVARPKPITTNAEDTLVADARAGLTPAQIVDGKFFALLAAATRKPASGTGVP